MEIGIAMRAFSTQLMAGEVNLKDNGATGYRAIHV